MTTPARRNFKTIDTWEEKGPEEKSVSVPRYCRVHSAMKVNGNDFNTKADVLGNQYEGVVGARRTKGRRKPWVVVGKGRVIQLNEGIRSDPVSILWGTNKSLVRKRDVVAGGGLGLEKHSCFPPQIYGPCKGGGKVPDRACSETFFS